MKGKDSHQPKVGAALRLVPVTAFEDRLLEALRAYPDRVAMWTELGDPLRNHRNLLALYCRFFDICNRNDIECWLEYGSLLGFVRHGGIIPWEWDMDVGCTSDNFQRLLEVGRTIDAQDKLFGFRYYHDPGYEEPAFSFYLRSDPNVLCDICEYRQEGDRLVCAAESWHYPSHAVDDVMPLRRVTLLGQSAFVPARAAAMLERTQEILGQTPREDGTIGFGSNRIPYTQYDPAPFVLSHLHHPGLTERLCSPPVADLEEAASISEGFERIGRTGRPFVVRRCRIVDLPAKGFLDRLAATETTVFGWDRDQLRVDDLSLRDVVANWRLGQLEPNILDAPIPGLFAPDEVDGTLATYGITSSTLMLIASREMTYTPFHQDPIYEGGGWMWLADGQKLWTLADFEHTDDLLDPVGRNLRDDPPASLLHREDYRMWGRLRQAWIEGGDFLYFPPGCSHRVQTYRRCIGLGGYAVLPTDQERRKKIVPWYLERGLDPAGGIWRGDRT